MPIQLIVALPLLLILFILFSISMYKEYKNLRKQELEILNPIEDDKELIAFAEWFNINQWRDGPTKALFCKSNYKDIVKEYKNGKSNNANKGK